MKNLLLSCFLLFLMACGKGHNAIPDNVLSLQKMADVMTDIHLADAASREELLPAKYSERQELWLFEVLKKHQTDTATYFRSLHFYSEHIELLDSIYGQVNVNLR